jgi:proline utilization trans-activator
MAHSHGLHTDLQADVIGPQLVRRGRRIWWTVYALERKLSSSMGVPVLLHDEDLTTTLPDAENSDVSATGQVIHVKIGRLLGEVVSSRMNLT